jgi:hypothetical protein
MLSIREGGGLHERTIVLQGDVTIETIDAWDDLKLVGAKEGSTKEVAPTGMTVE